MLKLIIEIKEIGNKVETHIGSENADQSTDLEYQIGRLFSKALFEIHRKTAEKSGADFRSKSNIPLS